MHLPKAGGQRRCKPAQGTNPSVDLQISSTASSSHVTPSFDAITEGRDDDPSTPSDAPMLQGGLSPPPAPKKQRKARSTPVSTCLGQRVERNGTCPPAVLILS